MNTVHRFFRRYIFSTVGIVILFLAVNLALFFTILITGSISGADPSFSVQDFSDHVVLQDEKWVADDTALSMLQEQSAWAMLLDEDGDVVWQQDLPENLPRSYTSAEVASFSRWYLEDYPVKIWTRADGNLMVVGYQPGTLVKYYFSLEWPYMGVMLAHSARYSKFKSRKSAASGGARGTGRNQRRTEPGRRLYEEKGQHKSGVDSRRIPRHPHTAFDGAGVCQRAGR